MIWPMVPWVRGASPRSPSGKSSRLAVKKCLFMVNVVTLIRLSRASTQGFFVYFVTFHHSANGRHKRDGQKNPGRDSLHPLTHVGNGTDDFGLVSRYFSKSRTSTVSQSLKRLGIGSVECFAPARCQS